MVLPEYGDFQDRAPESLPCDPIHLIEQQLQAYYLTLEGTDITFEGICAFFDLSAEVLPQWNTAFQRLIQTGFLKPKKYRGMHLRNKEGHLIYRRYPVETLT